MFPNFMVTAVIALQHFKRPAPTDSGRTDLGDRPALPFVGSRACDSVLIDRKQLGFSLRVSAPTTGAWET